ncbi:protein ROOT PRIMORDIUM DEFECTIVE 1 [Hordeum vulgare]|nr:protein ROOT PRIMORDIUM DEFECTIVE 1 [Hordeum vulgare]
MARRLFSAARALVPPVPAPAPAPVPASSSAAAEAAASLLPLLPCKRRKKLLKKLNSPRIAPIEPEADRRVPALDAVLDRDAAFRFLSRARSFMASLPPPHRIPLAEAGKLYRELGFPRGRSVSRAAARHPLLFTRTTVGSVPHLAFTPLMCSLLEEERRVHEELLPARVLAVRKLLMLTAHRRLPLAKLHHCRAVLGLPDDFRDRVRDYPDDFRVAVDPDGLHVLELAHWDPALAVSALEHDFMVDERRVRRTFRFSVPHRRSMPLDGEEAERLDAATTFPLVSPYTNGALLRPWTPEAEKYRVGVVHEFLSLTLEKRALIHHVFEFKEELGLTRHMYQSLRKQTRAFYLAGTEMNWAVFLRDAYDDDGVLRDKDPLVLFNEKLQGYACMTEMDPRRSIAEC